MVSGEELRILMRNWTTGVTLVTARDERGPHGMTVSSFTSVSLEPPRILISLERTARTHGIIEAGGAFGVSILEESQSDLAERFAGRIGDGEDRFAGVEYDLTPTGVPIPRQSLAYFECRVVEAFPAATHTLFVGDVLSGRQMREAQPLVYFQRDYRHLG
jgi:flavin reductase (DIM6/NTAB) family NADH-FMN oxidoreductase RutF